MHKRYRHLGAPPSFFFNQLSPAEAARKVVSGVPRVGYLTRVGLLGEYEDALAFFDALVSSEAHRQAGLQQHSPSPQLSTPLRQGGFAFRSHTYLAPFAFMGAFAQAASRIQRVCAQLPPLFAASVEATLLLVRERVGPDALPLLPPTNNPQDALAFFSSSTPHKLQKSLSLSASRRSAELLLQSASPAEAARDFACFLLVQVRGSLIPSPPPQCLMKFTQLPVSYVGTRHSPRSPLQHVTVALT